MSSNIPIHCEKLVFALNYALYRKFKGISVSCEPFIIYDADRTVCTVDVQIHPVL